MRLVWSLFCLSTALPDSVFVEDETLSLLQIRAVQSDLAEQNMVFPDDEGLSFDNDEDSLLQDVSAAGKVRVRIDGSPSNSKCVKAPVPVTCAADAGNLGKRTNNHGARDTFEITTNGDEVCARRTDNGSGWGMHLEIECEEVVPDTSVHVMIDSSPSNEKCVSTPEPVVCEGDAGNLGNRLNSHPARDMFLITTNGNQVCARRTDAPQNGWGMRLEIACKKVPAPANVDVLIDNSNGNTKCVTAPVAVTCAPDAGNLGKRVNNHGAADTFEISSNGDRVCARRTDSSNGWGMHLEVSCTEVAPPSKVRVLIDRSEGNNKCVATRVPVSCAANAGDLGNRLNSHGARDTFAISANGAQVCARRTDSGNGWGMRLEVECTELPPPQVMNVLIDSSGSNRKCVAVSEPVKCDIDAGNLGKRINSHGARDTFEITTNGAQVCARRTDSPGSGWGMKLEVECRTGGEVAPAPPAPCRKTRRGPMTITRCPGKKTKVSMSVKGFNIFNMNARKRAVLEVFRNKVLQAYSRILNVNPAQLVVVFKPGSIIIIVEVDAQNVPDNFEAGDGPGDAQDILAELKEIPDVENLVEEGKRLEEGFVDPQPDFPVDDEANAVGDPHMTLATGTSADMCCKHGHCEPCSK